VMEEDFDAETMDACLIAGGQRAEHYEMAAYGTLVAWAKVLGHDEAAELLEEILAEEKAADEKLTALAEGGINEAAAGDAEPAEDESDEEVPTAKGAAKKAPSQGKGGSKKR
jgi:ferritin-like metal-binding protein YciE